MDMTLINEYEELEAKRARRCKKHFILLCAGFLGVLILSLLCSGCTTTAQGPTVGDGIVDTSTIGNGQLDIPQISPELITKLIPLITVLSASTGNPYAATLAQLIGKTSGNDALSALLTAQIGTGSSDLSLVKVNADGTLNAPETILAIYAKLSPEAQGQALALFVQYQQKQEVNINNYLALVYEVLNLIKAESPTMGALCEWGLKLYIDRTNG